jgi:hypothetical protein
MKNLTGTISKSILTLVISLGITSSSWAIDLDEASRTVQLSATKSVTLTPEQVNNIVNQTDGQIQSSLNDETIFEVNNELGYQKIIEVYKEYKAKGLIDINFPELTLAELTYKLEMS